MHWFPDRKGIASGVCIAGFGSGALLFTPLAQKLTKHFAKMPDYLGPAENFVVNSSGGRMFVDVDGRAVEVVQAVTGDLAKLAYTLPEGLYAVGSGSTGAAQALAVFAAGYFTVILCSASALRAPHPTFIPDGAPVSVSNPTKTISPTSDISTEEAIRCLRINLIIRLIF